MASIPELNSSNFESAIQAGDKPVIVDFWAPWCGPCKAIAPILEEIAEEKGEAVQVCKVNVDNNNELAGKFNIRAIPTLLIFRNGQLENQVVGMASKEDLLAKLGL
jgi:thioredoxin 1